MTAQIFDTFGSAPVLPIPEKPSTDWPWYSDSPVMPPRWAKRKNIQWPRISIVTPSYNQGQFIEATMRSVLLQNYPNLEHIVIDGGSTDNTRQVIQKYEAFLTYWVSERDRGQTDAINKGFSHATGEVLGWLNSDDLLLPDALWHIGYAFATQPNTNVVYGFRKIINAEDQPIRSGIYWWPTPDILKYRCLISQETVYWRREVSEKIGSLDVGYHFAMDYEYWHRMLSFGYTFMRVPYFIGAFRVHTDSKSEMQFDAMQHDLDTIYQKYLGHSLGPNEINQVFGPDYAEIYQLVKDLNHTTLFQSRYIVIIILYVLSQPLLAKFILLIYRLYRMARGRNPLPNQVDSS